MKYKLIPKMSVINLKCKELVQDGFKNIILIKKMKMIWNIKIKNLKLKEN